MSAEIKSASVRLKSSQAAASSKGKGVASSDSSKKRAEDASSRRVSDSARKSVTAAVKTGVKEKTTVSSSSQTTTKTTTVTRVRQKKEYKLPGQRYDTPEEREPLRIFYESLSKQIPSSEMAEFWMMEHGMLSPDRAKRAFERKQKKQKELRMGTPIKSSTVRASKIERPESSQKPSLSKNGKVMSRKRALDLSDDDDDFIIKHKKGKG